MTATEIVNFGNEGRSACVICGDPANRHGIFEITSGAHKGFQFRCATILEDGRPCECAGYEPMPPLAGVPDPEALVRAAQDVLQVAEWYVEPEHESARAQDAWRMIRALRAALGEGKPQA